MPIPPVLSQLTTSELYKRAQALSIVETINSPEWSDRYFSINPDWSDNEQSAEGRDGQGDSLLIAFQPEGVAINGFCINEASAATSHLVGVDVPECFSEFYFGKPVATIGSSFCFYSLHDGKWRGREAEAGISDFWLGFFDGDPTTYRDWAVDYYDEQPGLEQPGALDVIASIYAHHPLSRAQVTQLAPDFDDWAMLKAEASAIGFPLGPDF
ncbi:hypothetical protein CMUST_05210 [Corynebacterium mustelae]|uniref:Uncharacterized protein n=1 Tax=Corynebacterium mustelae TaxID=571915 RepID=A0A0G3GXW8_9CORY|nr:hypothetical protein [Corynebacterium mustelae]AKK05380.1 hypothetical protein CMUST_05210 [Corynebacterium mustelae]